MEQNTENNLNQEFFRDYNASANQDVQSDYN